MKSIVLADYNANIVRAIKNLSVREMDIPIPGPDQVLIKVAAAPCNPSDIAFMRGSYSITRSVPITMGFECSGTVVDSGNSSEAKKLPGKSVSALSQDTGTGTWSEYCVTEWNNCLVLEADLDMDQAAALCVNPFTAYALIQKAREKGCDTVIQNAASGQVGAFIRTLAKKIGIRVINIVRRKEHASFFNSSGEDMVLYSADPGFEKKLAELAWSNNARIAFDAVGGELSGVMINAMPERSELIIYGGLSGRPASGIHTTDIIFRGKRIKGFHLEQWRKETGRHQVKKVSKEIQRMMMDGILKTSFQGSFKLEDVQIAVKQYIRNMSAGKVLLKPF